MEKYSHVRELKRGSILLLVAAAVFCFVRAERHIADEYYAAALRAHGIAFDSTDARTAYASALAQRSPLMDLSGTDPDRLREAARRLEALSTAYAALPAAPGEERLDRTTLLRALYPADFLKALADLERARRTLVLHPAPAAAGAYGRALREASRAGLQDIRRFREAFTATLGAQKDARIMDIGGIIPVSSLTDAVSGTQYNLERTVRAVLLRERCLGGDVFSCDPAEPAQPAPDYSAPVPVSAEKLAAAQNIRSIFSAALASPEFSNRTVVILERSACVGSLNGPYFFSAPSQAQFNPSSLPYFLGDIFFTPTKTDAPTLNYLRESLGIAYSFVNPLTYYRCPDVGLDVSGALAVALTRHFIGDNSASFSPALRTKTREIRSTLPAYLTESDAKQFLAYALALEQNPALRAEALELSRMFNNKSAGLDRLAGAIADTGESHLRAHALGLGTDTSLAFLFLTQSAFPSLYQSYNRSFGTHAAPALRTTDAAGPVHVERYSQLRSSVPVEQFIRDLRAFFSFERGE